MIQYWTLSRTTARSEVGDACVADTITSGRAAVNARTQWT